MRASRRIGDTKVAGPVGRAVRDVVMPIALRLVAGRRTQAWLWDYPIEQIGAEVP